MKKDVIAIVGAGKGGTAILETLLDIPKVCIKYVYDINKDAHGIKLAAKHRIKYNVSLKTLCSDPELNLIIEVTGKQSVYEDIMSMKQENTTVIGAKSTEIIFHFLDYQSRFNKKLEKEVKNRTRQLEISNEELQKINDEKTKYLMHATHQLKPLLPPYKVTLILF
jgi:predicted dinucleotide-utilizing enzyme